MSRLVAAAIRFYPKDSKYPQIVCGERHSDCFEWMFTHRVEYDKQTHEQGFLTESNQFIDRYSAMYLAHDQLLNPEDYKPGSPLYSEDLW